jgi:hypothetical protein
MPFYARKTSLNYTQGSRLGADIQNEIKRNISRPRVNVSAGSLT